MTGKLVRDKVPDVIRAGGREPIVRPAWRNEIEGLFKAKILEEAGELLLAGSPEDRLEELVDIVEVAFAYAHWMRQADGEVPFFLEAKSQKKRALGGFERLLVWEGNLEPYRDECNGKSE